MAFWRHRALYAVATGPRRTKRWPARALPSDKVSGTRPITGDCLGKLSCTLILLQKAPRTGRVSRSARALPQPALGMLPAIWHRCRFDELRSRRAAFQREI